MGVPRLRRRPKMPIFGALWCPLQKAQPLVFLLSQRSRKPGFPIGVLAESSVTAVLCFVWLLTSLSLVCLSSKAVSVFGGDFAE